MDQVTLVKNQYRLEQWTKLIQECQSSGIPAFSLSCGKLLWKCYKSFKGGFRFFLIILDDVKSETTHCFVSLWIIGVVARLPLKGVTKTGDEVYIGAFTHIAHDVTIEDHVVSNSIKMFKQALTIWYRDKGRFLILISINFNGVPNIIILEFPQTVK